MPGSPLNNGILLESGDSTLKEDATYLLLEASGGVFGTGAITLASLSVSGAGTFADVATGAITLGALSPSGAGTFASKGSGAITLGALSPAGTGSFTVTGSGSVSLAGLNVAGVGATGQIGAGSITLAALGVSGAGATANVGAGAITLGSVIVAGIGTFSGGIGNYDVVTGIQQWFLMQPSLQGLFSDSRLNHKSAPEETLLPYATYFLVSDVAETYTTGYAFRRATVHFNVHADTDAAAVALRDQFADALNSVLNAEQFPIAVYGQYAIHTLPEGYGVDIGEGLGPDGNDCWIAFFELDVPYTK